MTDYNDLTELQARCEAAIRSPLGVYYESAYKRYLLFAFNDHEENGGIEDLLMDSDDDNFGIREFIDVKDNRRQYFVNGQFYDNIQIVDLLTKKIIIGNAHPPQ